MFVPTEQNLFSNHPRFNARQVVFADCLCGQLARNWPNWPLRRRRGHDIARFVATVYSSAHCTGLSTASCRTFDLLGWCVSCLELRELLRWPLDASGRVRALPQELGRDGVTTI